MKTLQKKKLKSEKLKAIRQMGITINHEINNPLSGVLGNIELLLLDNNLDKITRNKLSKIRLLSLKIRDVVKKFSEIDDVSTTKYCSHIDMIDIKT